MQFTIQSVGQPSAANMTLQAQLQPFAETRRRSCMLSWNSGIQPIFWRIRRKRSCCVGTVDARPGGQLAGHINIENHPLPRRRSKRCSAVRHSYPRADFPELADVTGCSSAIRKGWSCAWTIGLEQGQARSHRELGGRALDPQQLYSRS